MNERPHIFLTDVMDRLLKRVMAYDRAEKFCYGVTLTQAYTIGSLHMNPNQTMMQLSGELGLAISTLTRIIDILERDEIVQRSKDLDDRRKVLINLTKKGSELAEKLRTCSTEFWKMIIDLLPEEEREPTIKHLNMLLTAMEKAERTCCKK